MSELFPGTNGRIASWQNDLGFPENKRIGATALITLLDLNGDGLKCTEQDETEMVLRVAVSEMSEEEWTARVERSVLPLP